MNETRRLIQPTIAFQDPAFDTAHCEKFCLILQVAAETVSFTVLDNLTNDFLAFEQYHFRKSVTETAMAEQLAKLAAEHEWLSNGFKRTDVIVVTEKFTLVPAALFDSSRTSDYLKFNQPVGEQDLALNDLLRNADARNVYAIDPRLETAIKRITASARIRHHLSPLIERNLAVHKNKAGKRAFAHVQQGRFDLVLTDGGILQMANTFRFQTSEDFIYFLLYSCEQLKFNPEELELEIAGEVETDSAITGMAKKYIRNLSFSNRPDARFAKGFEQFPAHFHFNLFAAHYYA